MEDSEPTGYENEPDEIFHRLPQELYPRFFHIEMENDTEDCHYYQKQLLKHNCKKILELGCGTGRIQERLHRQGFNITGIDYSRSMLDFSKTTRSVPVAEMDMCQLGFTRVFDALIIPNNTFNLLRDESSICHCLSAFKDVLCGPSLVLMQLFCLDDSLAGQPHQRHFQFNLFDLEPGRKLIKESISVFHPEKNILCLEQRYKMRSFDCPDENQNYSQTLELAAFPYHKWKTVFENVGFTVIATHGDYDCKPFVPDSSRRLLICLKIS